MKIDDQGSPTPPLEDLPTTKMPGIDKGSLQEGQLPVVSPGFWQQGRRLPQEDEQEENTLVAIQVVTGRHLKEITPGQPPQTDFFKARIIQSDRYQNWIPGTFGFDEPFDDVEIDRNPTIPMMILRGVAKGTSEPVMDSEISGAAGNAAIISIGNMIGTVLRYISNLIIQRGFGAGPFGLYSLCLSLITLAMSIFLIGLDSTMVRFTSIYQGKRQIPSLQALIIFCTVLVGVTGVVGAFMMLKLAPILVASEHTTDVFLLLQVMAPMIPLLCVQVIWFCGLQGLKAFKWRVLTERILVPFTLLILLVGTVLFFHSVTGIALATLASTIVGAVFGCYFLFRQVFRGRKSEPKQYQVREWLSYSSLSFVSSIVDMALESIDTLMLAFFAVSAVGIGQYTAALKISTFVSMPLTSFDAMFAPTIAELYDKGEMERLSTMVKIVTKWSIVFSLPIFGIATVFSYYLLGISGDSFSSAWPLLIALSAGNMVNTATGSTNYLLYMTGNQKYSFFNSLTAVAVNVALGVILTPLYGAMGIAISTGIAMAVLNLIALVQIRLLLKIQPYRWDVLKPFISGAISAALTGALLYLFDTINLPAQFQLFHLPFQLLLVPVFLASYIGMIILFKISPEDKIVLDALYKKIKRSENK